jgi:S1-C subfamily serine protease
VEVGGFDERGPASRSGLRQGDIVVGLDDAPVAGIDDIHRALQRWSTERVVRLRVLRDRVLADVEVRAVEAPG